jgi:hypothetical protein
LRWTDPFGLAPQPTSSWRQALSSFWDQAVGFAKQNDLIQFGLGTAIGGLQGLAPGGGIADLGYLKYFADGMSASFNLGKGVGEVGVGVAQIIVGGAGAITGAGGGIVLALPTGGLATAGGLALAGAGAATAANGAVSTLAGIANIGQALDQLKAQQARGLQSSAQGSGSAPNAQTATPGGSQPGTSGGANATAGAERGIFSIGPYRPSGAPLENHHGVLDVWASHNIPGYVSRGANTPTIALTEAQHAATKAVYRDWLFEQTGRRVGGSVNWSQVSPREIQSLTSRMFDAVSVPAAARADYFRAFHQYIYGVAP